METLCQLETFDISVCAKLMLYAAAPVYRRMHGMQQLPGGNVSNLFAFSDSIQPYTTTRTTTFDAAHAFDQTIVCFSEASRFKSNGQSLRSACLGQVLQPVALCNKQKETAVSFCRCATDTGMLLALSGLTRVVFNGIESIVCLPVLL